MVRSGGHPGVTNPPHLPDVHPLPISLPLPRRFVTHNPPDSPLCPILGCHRFRPSPASSRLFDPPNDRLIVFVLWHGTAGVNSENALGWIFPIVDYDLITLGSLFYGQLSYSAKADLVGPSGPRRTWLLGVQGLKVQKVSSLRVIRRSPVLFEPVPLSPSRRNFRLSSSLLSSPKALAAATTQSVNAKASAPAPHQTDTSLG